MIRINARTISILIVCVMLLELTLRNAGASSKLIATVNIGSDKQVHIVNDDGREYIVPKVKDQVDCTAPKIAEDKRTAGWLIDSDNCCTSYPIPLMLVIYRNGKIIQRFEPGQSIWDWQFVKGGSQIAFWIGPTHGASTPHFELHNVRGGQLIAEWDGHVSEAHPEWVSGLKE